MNVLVTVLNPIGGIRTYLKYTYKNFEYAGCNITLLLKDKNGELTRDLIQEFTGLSINVIKVESLYQFYSTSMKLVSENKIDLIHSHGFKSSFLSHIVSIFKKKPHILTCHELITERHFEDQFGRIYRILLKSLLGRVDLINTVSRDATINLKEFGIQRDDIVLIENGIDVEYFKTGELEDIKNVLKIEKHRKLMGFFGRFMPEKGFRVLVEAFNLLYHDSTIDNDTLPIVVTYGWGGFIREEYEYIEQLGLSKYFVQQPATNQVPTKLRSLDAVIIPSMTEACGLIAIETLCVETPVIGTNCNGLREVLEGTPAFVAQVGSAQSLKECIVNFLVDDHLSQFKEYGETARNRFNVVKSSHKLKMTYEVMMPND